MQAIATQKFVRMSPRKLRLVADMVRDLTPQRAVEILPQIGKRAGEPLGKVMKTAIANAKVKGISSADLIIKEIQINEGPRLKRGRPVSRGRWHPYKRRMSHIRIILKTKEMKNQGTKEQKNKTKKVVKRKSKSENKIKRRVYGTEN